MMVATTTALVTRALKLLPRRVHDALDGWSFRVAQRQRLARLQRGLRKVEPLKPVITGRVALPQSFSS